MILATANVPWLSIVFMVISMLAMLLVPLAFMMYVNMRFKTLYGEVAKGAIAYILMVILFSGCLSQVIFSAGGEQLANSTLPRMLVAILVPVTVEVCGLAMVLGRRMGDKLDFAKFMQYGCGFALAELLLVAAGSLINNITYSIMFNTEGMEGLVARAGEELAVELAEFVGVLAAANPFSYLLPSIEGLLYGAFRIGVIMMIYMMMKGRLAKAWLGMIYLMYVTLILPTVMVDMGVFPKAVLHILLVGFCVLYIMVFVRNLYKGCREECMVFLGKEKLKKK